MPKQKSKKKQKRQKPFQKRRQYDQSDVENAVQAVSLQKISVREAANLFNVPKSTISDKIKGKTQIDVKLGHPPLISKEVEDELCARLINYTQRGFPLVPEDVRRLAYLYCGKMGVDHPFNKTIGLAGRVWFKNFTQRHPVLSERTPENLSRARARAADPVATEAWFNEIKQILTEKGVIDKPHLMYNADESGFTYVPDPPKTVVGVKGAKNTPLISSGEKGANTTLIAGMSATGHFTPPFIIHNGSQRLLETHKLHFPPGTCHTQTKVGYVNSLVWVTFLEHLGKYRVQPGPGETTVLFIDGHGSHVYPPEAHLKAIELNIVTICLPPHMTSYIQPLDVGFFGPMKHYYQKELVKWMRLHRGDIVTRNEFGAIFSESWAAAIKEQTAINAFRRSGLYPFDFSALSEEVFRPGEIFHEPVAESADMLLFEEFDPQGGDQENVQPNNWLETTTASVVNYELEQFQHIPPIQQNVPMIHQDVPWYTQHNLAPSFISREYHPIVQATPSHAEQQQVALQFQQPPGNSYQIASPQYHTMSSSLFMPETMRHPSNHFRHNFRTTMWIQRLQHLLRIKHHTVQ